MKLYDLLADTGISFGLLRKDTEITSITCDSRRVEPGSLFVCIEGTAVDGYRFAEAAHFVYITKIRESDIIAMEIRVKYCIKAITAVGFAP